MTASIYKCHTDRVNDSDMQTNATYSGTRRPFQVFGVWSTVVRRYLLSKCIGDRNSSGKEARSSENLLSGQQGS